MQNSQAAEAEEKRLRPVSKESHWSVTSSCRQQKRSTEAPEMAVLMSLHAFQTRPIRRLYESVGEVGGPCQKDQIEI